MNLLLARISESAIAPALELLPARMDTPPARVALLAIGLQESRFEHRYQVVGGTERGPDGTARPRKGPARGLWQFERGNRATRGGVWGVALHAQSADLLRNLCAARGCSVDPPAIWAQLEHDDVLAAGVARLLLWTNPKPLPALGEEQAAWNYYATTWRPGKPHPEFWPGNYARALAEVTSTLPPLTKGNHV